MPKEPPVLLIAILSHPFPVQGIADALLIEAKGRTSEQIVPPDFIGELPWGVVWEEEEIKGLDLLKAKGCDFLVLNTLAPATILKEEMGKFLKVEPSLAEGLIRAINQLPLDGVVLPLEITHLSLQDLLLCQYWVSLVRKPVLVLLSPELNIEDLRYIVDTGVKGIIVKGEKDLLTGWKRYLSSFAPKENIDIILPRQVMPSVEGEEEEEEGLS